MLLTLKLTMEDVLLNTFITTNLIVSGSRTSYWSTSLLKATTSRDLFVLCANKKVRNISN